jgi:predicted XRE-type DNA-binding protein
MTKNNQKKSFKEVLAEIESPQDWGNGSWSLPENSTPLEKAKYQLCRQIVVYKQDNNLSTEKIAQKINLTNSETQDILFYHIDYFTLDRLITYAGRLFSNSEIKIIVEPKKDNHLHARAV